MKKTRKRILDQSEAEKLKKLFGNKKKFHKTLLACGGWGGFERRWEMDSKEVGKVGDKSVRTVERGEHC